jgi:hypothetical protein
MSNLKREESSVKTIEFVSLSDSLHEDVRVAGFW